RGRRERDWHAGIRRPQGRRRKRRGGRQRRVKFSGGIAGESAGGRGVVLGLRRGRGGDSSEARRGEEKSERRADAIGPRAAYLQAGPADVLREARLQLGHRRRRQAEE